MPPLIEFTMANAAEEECYYFKKGMLPGRYFSLVLSIKRRYT